MMKALNTLPVELREQPVAALKEHGCTEIINLLELDAAFCEEMNPVSSKDDDVIISVIKRLMKLAKEHDIDLIVIHEGQLGKFFYFLGCYITSKKIKTQFVFVGTTYQELYNYLSAGYTGPTFQELYGRLLSGSRN